MPKTHRLPLVLASQHKTRPQDDMSSWERRSYVRSRPHSRNLASGQTERGRTRFPQSSQTTSPFTLLIVSLYLVKVPRTPRGELPFSDLWRVGCRSNLCLSLFCFSPLQYLHRATTPSWWAAFLTLSITRFQEQRYASQLPARSPSGVWLATLRAFSRFRVCCPTNIP